MKPCKLSIILLLLLLSCMSIPAAVTAISYQDNYVFTEPHENFLTPPNMIGNPTFPITMQSKLYLNSNVAGVYHGFRYISFKNYDSAAFHIRKNGEIIGGESGIQVTLKNNLDDIIGTGDMSFSNSKDTLGNWKGGLLSLYLDYFDSNNLGTYRNGGYSINIFADSGDVYTFSGYGLYADSNPYTASNPSLAKVVFAGIASDTRGYTPGSTYNAFYKEFDNTVSGEYGGTPGFNNIQIIRNGYASNLSVYTLEDDLIAYSYGTDDWRGDLPFNEYYYILTDLFNNQYIKILQLIAEEKPTVSVLASVKNIQDYSVIGDSTISFVSDTENITRTLPNGYDLFTLEKDTWYNVSATAEGFTPQLEYEPNLWTGSSAIDVWMIPSTEESNETVQMNFYVSESNSASSGNIRLKQAIITLNGEKTLITDKNGYASTVLNRTGSISYIIHKEGYVTYSRTFSPNWETYTHPTIDEHIQLLRIGEPEGGVTPVPTPDTRSSNQKAESAMNILFDNIEGIVQLAVVVLIISLISMIAGGGKKR